MLKLFTHSFCYFLSLFSLNKTKREKWIQYLEFFWKIVFDSLAVSRWIWCLYMGLCTWVLHKMWHVTCHMNDKSMLKTMLTIHIQFLKLHRKFINCYSFLILNSYLDKLQYLTYKSNFENNPRVTWVFDKMFYFSVWFLLYQLYKNMYFYRSYFEWVVVSDCNEHIFKLIRLRISYK